MYPYRAPGLLRPRAQHPRRCLRYMPPPWRRTRGKARQIPYPWPARSQSSKLAYLAPPWRNDPKGCQRTTPPERVVSEGRSRSREGPNAHNECDGPKTTMHASTAGRRTGHIALMGGASAATTAGAIVTGERNSTGDFSAGRGRRRAVRRPPHQVLHARGSGRHDPFRPIGAGYRIVRPTRAGIGSRAGT